MMTDFKLDRHLIQKGLSSFFWGVFALSSSVATAMPKPMQVVPEKIAIAPRAGVFAGGQSNDEFSILAIRRESSDEGVERLVIEYGDRFGRPLQGEPGFFHVAVDRKATRVVIDLAQVNRTVIDQKELAQLLASSKFVADSDMTMDPHDASTNITLNMKTPVVLSVASSGRGQGRLILEIRDLSSGQKK